MGLNVAIFIFQWVSQIASKSPGPEYKHALNYFETQTIPALRRFVKGLIDRRARSTVTLRYWDCFTVYMDTSEIVM